MEIFTKANQKLTFGINEPLNDSHAYCPLSNSKGKKIHRKTLANHLPPNYWGAITDEGYYYCSLIECPVIYFNKETGDIFSQDELRIPVMHKIPIGTKHRPACYCMNVLEETILDELLVKKCCDSLIDIQNFTKANTGKDCAITNPTGRCCGRQIRDILNWAKEKKLDIEIPLIEEAEACCVNIDEATENFYEELVK